MNDVFASAPHQAVCTAERSDTSPRRYSLAALRSAIVSWREQTHFRWELKRISRDNPHLIDDIGLTRRQVEEEIAKLPFWQR
ncbi:MAG: DUF1127 domain-containing protein [Mesorhizobium sp.]|uniref:DUF1127 domain-containing protein n=1 Tax=Mesorhizobium sp. TaxID=1871066 RepID=UPI0012203367|nr:DUF1127 domain-containing protein [Mesorhizobium sp.]TIQ35431.1 MAG: DUF1127 domain-containing protein [Mesorhizobium sp.]